MTKKLLMNKIGGNSESNPYEILEYIEGTGTQYINTEVVPTLNTKIELELYFQKKNITYSYLFGCDTFAKINFSAYVSTVDMCKYGKKVVDIKIPEISDAKCTYILDMHNRSKYIQIIKDDSEISTPDLSTMSKDFTTNYFYILNAYTGSGSVSRAYASKGRIYSCKIWEKEELIRNFIPVLDNDNTPCLYDSINNKCYYNVGTGSFEYPQ